MTELRHVYERQEALREARRARTETWEGIYWGMEPRERDRVDISQHPAIREYDTRIANLEEEVAHLRDEVGGRVYRVVSSKVGTLRDRIEKLNRRAAKLGVEPVTLTISDEHDEIVRKVPDPMALAPEVEPEYIDEIVDFTFVTVDGETPMVPGYVFVAVLDHTVQGDDDDPVAIRRVPIGSGLRARIGEAEARAAEDVDLDPYRHAPNRCDHCGTHRQRNQTFIFFETETGETKQVGSTCLRDYTGANNPDAVARWAEHLAALDYDLGLEGGDDGFGGIGAGGGRLAIPTQEYLANVVACIRERGWTPGWRRDEYTGEVERQEWSTAIQAHANLSSLRRGRSKEAIDTTEDDWHDAAETLEWVREDLADRENLDEYQHNLVTYCRTDYLPEKGEGFIASAIMARRREIERALERELAAGSEFIANEGDRVKGLTFTVTFVREHEGNYGLTYITKGVTPDGNRILWYASRALERGKTYTMAATVKRHTLDSYADDAKTTQINRPHGIEEVDAPEGGGADTDEIEVVMTAEEREAAKARRLERENVARADVAAGLHARIEEVGRLRTVQRPDLLTEVDQDIIGAHLRGEISDEARERLRGLVADQGVYDRDGEHHTCLEGADGCVGPVGFHSLPGRSDMRAFPRCIKHFDAALTVAQRTVERYGGAVPRADFDPSYAGERWDEDY